MTVNGHGLTGTPYMRGEGMPIVRMVPLQVGEGVHGGGCRAGAEAVLTTLYGQESHPEAPIGVRFQTRAPAVEPGVEAGDML